jgi:hypothetical protein
MSNAEAALRAAVERYRGAALAELTRCLKTLQALQAAAQAEAAAAPACRRGRPTLPANGRKTRVPGIVPHPLATRRDLVATAAPPARVPAASPSGAAPPAPTSLQRAIGALLFPTERTRGTTPDQFIGLRTERWRGAILRRVDPSYAGPGRAGPGLRANGLAPMRRIREMARGRSASALSLARGGRAARPRGGSRSGALARGCRGCRRRASPRPWRRRGRTMDAPAEKIGRLCECPDLAHHARVPTLMPGAEVPTFAPRSACCRGPTAAVDAWSRRPRRAGEILAEPARKSSRCGADGGPLDGVAA